MPKKPRLTYKNKKKGFTLVELLIVTGIIGAIAAFLILVINPVTQFQKSRDAKRKTDVLSIQAALEQYKAENGAYPTSAPSSSFLNNTICAQPLTVNNTTYVRSVPCDPLGSNSNYNNGNYYYYSADGTSYSLGACLERKDDPDGQSSPP